LFKVIFKVLEALELLLQTLFTRNPLRKTSSGVGLGTVVAKDYTMQESSFFFAACENQTHETGYPVHSLPVEQ
jgi:hypothetical protein